MHIIIHNEAGEIRNKYRPVTDFVRVVSVGACPKPMTVDTPVRFIHLHRHFKYVKKLSNERFLDIRELDENFLTYYKIPRYIEW